MSNFDANRLLTLELDYVVESNGKLVAAFAIDLKTQIQKAGPEVKEPK